MRYFVVLLALAGLVVGCASVGSSGALALQKQKEWKATQMILDSKAIDLTILEQPIMLGFEPKEKRVYGISGCNSFFGLYTLNGQKIKISYAGMTRKLCHPLEVMDIENQVAKNLLSVENTMLFKKGQLIFSHEGFEIIFQ